MCDASLKFSNIVATWPGATHDARIFENSRLYTQLENGHYNGRHLLGDSGYALRTFLLTPVLNPVLAEDTKYNRAHASTRNTIERAFGVFKRRFAVLNIPMRTKLRTSKIIIMACAVLHNIAISQRFPILNEQGLEEECLPIGEEEEGEAIPPDARDNHADGVDGIEYRRAFIQRWFT